MHSTVLKAYVRNDLKLEFNKLFFSTRQSIWFICRTLNDHIDARELAIWWYLDTCTDEFSELINGVLNQLKDE